VVTAADTTAQRRIRVLHVVGKTVGGTGTHLRLLVENLDREMFAPSIAFTGPDPIATQLGGTDTTFFDYAGGSAKPGFVHSRIGPAEILRRYRRLRRHIAETKPDIVHTHTSPAGVLGRLAARANGVPVVIHTVHAFASHDFVASPQRQVFRWLERALDRITTHYVVATDAIRRIGVERRIFEPARVALIPHAIDGSAHPADGGAALRRSIGVASDSPLIGFVGRLERQKGPDHLGAILPDLMHRAPALHVVIAGEGAMRAELERDVTDAGLEDRVHFLGWQEQAAPVMAAIDMLVLPSRWEAFGLVILEAALASIPTVGFAVEGIPEVVVDGETGLLVDAGDRVGLTEAILTLVGDPDRCRAMGRAALDRYLTTYATERMVNSHEVLYRSLVDGSGAGPLRPSRQVTTE
jgi:glycosyltransferase involved in cell wall biosynthesis